ncbi:short-chain dehydrogenase [Streptomyces abyssalis]|uniref:Short-chain dehydrogenase n=1 Tax=Streptomyces abyssalis TaxID=933944 RepID=A0A1E7JR65_9ACTN|nr:SDR family oxidoreductase [Streptomyces abyssalis]OEU90772.1 short-chain dehydrogenase [Streptomyces abyssalis]OEU95390.1 short-chain dehydrogenase [Streptomyces abyssalis]
MEGARERRVRTPEGVELCVAELGDAELPTVVLVHGYPDSKEVWSKVARRLSERFHVVLYDVRGCGRSSAPKPLRGGFTLEKLTQDFLAVTGSVSPGRPVHVVGHDWGSVQGWEFATAPETRGRIASFTSMSGPSLDHLGHWIRKRVSRPTPRRLAQTLGQGARSWYIYALHTPVLPELAWRGPLSRYWPKLLRRAEKLQADGYPTSSLPRDAAHGAWLYRDNMRARLRHPREDCHAHVPVQMITPTRDVFLSERLYDDVELWAPGLTRRTLDAKHWIPRTRPDQLAVWIGDFVDAQESGRAGGSEQPVRATAGRGAFAERFGGRLVLVTGAGSGIGRATALSFAAAGARVVAVDVDGERAAHTAQSAERAGAPRAWAETVDVGDQQQMEKLAARVAEEYGTVDVLVNNAGIGVAGPFLDTSVEDWKRTLDVNLWGVIHGCRLFGAQMAERGQGGHIVNVASDAAYQPTRLLPAYGTSKAAVLMLSESLRAELAGRDIGVTAVCPGPVKTDITRTAHFVGLDEAGRRRRRARVTRLYELRNYPPEKVAKAIMRAVVRNQAVVPVTPEARGARVLARVSPRLLRAIARIEPPL